MRGGLDRRQRNQRDDAGTLAVASAQIVHLNVPGLPAIEVDGVTAISGTQCIGTRAYASIARLQIGPRVLIGKAQQPAPNTTINLLVGKLILNEQLPVPGADQGVQVNALHLIVPGVEDVIVASATSGIHGC